MPEKVAYKVLLPTDGSIPALAATKYAVDLVKRMGGHLVVLYVKEPSPMTPLERLAEDTALMRTKVDGVEYARKLADQESIPIEVLIRDGSVAGEIIKTAEGLPADMIVMGSSSPKGLSGFFLGHVAEVVIKAVPHSVTVVKPTQQDIIELEEKAKTLITVKIEQPVVRVGDAMKLKIALTLFSLYVIGYAVFTVLGSFNKALFSIRIGGLNWGVFGGMTIIISAIIIGICYNWYSSRLEKRQGVA